MLIQLKKKPFNLWPHQVIHIVILAQFEHQMVVSYTTSLMFGLGTSIMWLGNDGS